jgi:hypothetical protein
VYSVSAWPDPATALLDTAFLSMQYVTAPGASPLDVALYRWNGTQWTQLPACTVDAAQHTVSAPVTSPGTFAVFPTAVVTEAAAPGRPATFGVRLFPQPANESVVIAMETEAADGTLRISNALGETMHTARVEAAEGRFASLRIDTRAWPAGVYFCTFRSGARFETTKLLVRH